ncbi:zinc finger protein [Colletotrichum asianum]|uniref:Zinc finger protein n=1 Tax=Colletotrichum asianum TaxID=702518 RepID=A0A8H3ZXX1_9PEZI|nr:zinc finger protein [Colletotrichum asianum]
MLRNTRDALFPRLLDWTVVLAEAKTVREGTYWERNGGVVSASTLSGQNFHYLSQPNQPPSPTVAFYLDTSIQPNLVDSCYCVLLGNDICYCEHYYANPTTTFLKLESVTDPPIPLLSPASPTAAALGLDLPPLPSSWRSPTAPGVMECPLATPSSSSESSTNLLSPLNPEIAENECDRASDSGLTTASSSSGDNNFCSAVSPVAAAAAPAGLVGGTIDISRMRFECRWNSCGKVFRRPSDLTKHERYHIKEYRCDEAGCDKAFATQKDLKRHKKTHETLDGDSAGYRCRVPGCRKAKTGHVYNRRDNFVRHLRTKHVGMEFDVREELEMMY